jgi:hypothetical protein
VRKLFKEGNYSRAETIRGNTISLLFEYSKGKCNFELDFDPLWGIETRPDLYGSPSDQN